MEKLIQIFLGKIPCTVIISKTVQEQQYEPFVIELQETKWVDPDDYDDTHFAMYKRLEKRMDKIMKDRWENV